MKTRILSIIIALLGLASGAQAASWTYNISIYDGKTISKNDYAMLQAVANVERKLDFSVMGTTTTFKDLSGKTLFWFDTKTMILKVPSYIEPEDVKVTLSDQSKEAVKKVDKYLANYNFVNLIYCVTINEQNFPDEAFREALIEICEELKINNIIEPTVINWDQFKYLDVSYSNISSGEGIHSLQGIEHITTLQTLDCSENKITTLNLSKNLYLNKIICYGNNISGSNMENFINNLPQSNGLGSLYVVKQNSSGTDNSMTCRQVFNALERGWVTKRYGSDEYYYGSDFVCSIDETNFPDMTFRNYVSDNFDTDKNMMLDQSEIANATKIDLYELMISDLKGIEYFTSLKILSCVKCPHPNLLSLDLRSNKLLTTLDCTSTPLSSLNVSGLTNLYSLKCSRGRLTSLDLSTCTNLAYLYCDNNQISSLKMQGGSTQLPVAEIVCNGNKLSGTNMTTFVNSLPPVKPGKGNLYITKNETSTGNIITAEQVKTATQKGYEIKIWDSSTDSWMTHPDSNPGIYTITVFDGATISALDLQILRETYAYAPSVMSGTLDGDNFIFLPNKNLNYAFTCNQNTRVCHPYSGSDILENIVLPVINDYNLYQNTSTIIKNYPIVEIRMGLGINSTNFPDENFRTWVRNNADTNKDGGLSLAEIANVKKIDVNNKSITSLKGIEYFTALQTLYCYQNSLTALDVSKNTALTHLLCFENKLTALDVSNNTALVELWCSANQLTTLDVSKNTALVKLWCNSNKLNTLDVSKNTALRELQCYHNSIRGKGMTTLVNSLPKVPEGEDMGELHVYASETSASNVMTAEQVNTALGKRWKVMRLVSSNWVDYEGLPEGDVNTDGSVNYKDREAIANYIMGKLPDADETFYDVDGNGKVDAADIVFVISILNK